MQKIRNPKQIKGFHLLDECGRWDLNPHKRNAYKILSLARLPVPTLPHSSLLSREDKIYNTSKLLLCQQFF